MHSDSVKFCTILLLLASILGFAGCALQGTPTGGEKDTLAPVLIKSLPATKTTNFQGKEIEVTFDELVQVENLQQELIITPDPNSEYEYKPTKYGMKLLFKKPFDQPNTTYTLSFRNAIKDITEKNISKDAKIVFSTGAVLDSTFVEGRVLDLLTGSWVENAVVSLYRSNDTLDVQKHKPYYFTKTDKNGRYRLENLRKGSYRMYALSDMDNNQKYTNEKEKISFLEENLIIANSSQKDIVLKLSLVDETPPTLARRSAQSDTYVLEMNEGIVEADVKIANSSENIAYAIEPKTPNRIRLYNTVEKYDSLLLKIIVKDSAGNKSTLEPTIRFTALDDKQKKRKTKLPFETNTNPKPGESILPDFKWEVIFNKPVTRYNPSLIRLLADTLTALPLDTSEVFWNLSKTKLTIQKKLQVRNGVRVLVPEGTFISVENDTAETIQSDHFLKDSEKFGSISGRVDAKLKFMIVQLVDASDQVIAEVRNQTQFMFRYLPAGEYRLRVIGDMNNNGKQDAASFKNRKPAEDVIYRQDKIRLKENWELTDQNLTIK